MVLEEQILALSDRPFSVLQKNKEEFYLRALKDLDKHHIKACEPYKKIVHFQKEQNKEISKVSDFPFVPVRLFKEIDLYSVDKSQIVRTMTSSGTTGQKVSKIFLDSYTANLQKKVLSQIMAEFFGSKRNPMLVIDARSTVQDRKSFSARGAAILGFSMFGRDITYALDSDMNLDFEAIEQFLDKHKGEDIFIFGFTFIVWKYFYQALLKSGKKLDLARASLLHGGGWKKLIDEKVERDEFKRKIQEVSGIKSCHDYYGMVEQTGSIFIECEHGHFHCSIYSDVITRNPTDFSVCENDQRGLLQLISLIPHSYPGYSILSEDVGVIHGADTCQCGRKGKFFSVLGRIAKAEVRGCSDTRN